MNSVFLSVDEPVDGGNLINMVVVDLYISDLNVVDDGAPIDESDDGEIIMAVDEVCPLAVDGVVDDLTVDGVVVGLVDGVVVDAVDAAVVVEMVVVDGFVGVLTGISLVLVDGSDDEAFVSEGFLRGV